MTQQHTQQWAQARRLALTVPCPECDAPKDTPCTRTINGQQQQLQAAPAHGKRIHLAENPPGQQQ